MLEILCVTVFAQTGLNKQFQIKNITRTISFTYGTYQIEEALINVQDIDEVRHKNFCYGIHLNHYEKIGYHQVVDEATGNVLKTQLGDFNDDFGCLNIDVGPATRTGDKKTQFQLYLYLEIIDAGSYLAKFTKVLNLDREPRYSELQNDRVYSFNIPAEILSPYHISTQTTYLQAKVNTFQDYKTEFPGLKTQNASQRIKLSKNLRQNNRTNYNKVDQLVIGPLEYAQSMEPKDVKVNVITSQPTMKINILRKVWVPGMFLGFSGKSSSNEEKMTNLHVIDNITLYNTDPWTMQYKESRRGQLQAMQLPVPFMVDQLEILLPLADRVRVYDRTGRITSLTTKSNSTHTKLIFKPRHFIFGGQSSDFTLEYDIINGAKGNENNNYGVVVQAAPRFQNIVHYFSNLVVCQYAPSTADKDQIKYYYSYQPKESYSESDIKSLDFNGRNGWCVKYTHVSQEVGQSNIAISYNVNLSFIKQRLMLPGIGAGLAICVTWLFRIIS